MANVKYTLVKDNLSSLCFYWFKHLTRCGMTDALLRNRNSGHHGEATLHRLRTPVRPMARPPQYDRDPYDEEPVLTAAAVRAAVKHLAPADRARLLAWLCLYYEDSGGMFSPQISRRRRRVMIDDVEYWLVRVPKRRR